MNNLVNKWKLLVTSTQAILNTEVPSNLPTNIPKPAPEVEAPSDESVTRPTQLEIRSVKVTESDQEFKPSSSESSDITGEPDVCDYQISQSSSKVFTLNKSSSNSYTTQLNIVLTKELPDEEVSIETENNKSLEKNEDSPVVENIIKAETELAEVPVEVDQRDNDEILNIIQNHAESGLELDNFLPVDNGHVKIVTLNEDSSINKSSVSNVDNVDEDGSLVVKDADSYETISNDLFDWLLWINHTIESQV